MIMKLAGLCIFDDGWRIKSSNDCTRETGRPPTVLPCLDSFWLGAAAEAADPSTEAAALLGRVGSRQAVLLLSSRH